MRKLIWFSCGAPSAVAAKLVVASGQPCEVLYTKVKEEHEDNMRFLADVEKWIGQKIHVLENEKYHGSIYEVFEKRKFLVGLHGAPCTQHLKREMREAYQQPGDIHIWGFTIEEVERMLDFQEAFPDIRSESPLIDAKLSKSDCLAMVRDADIALPTMYLLGFNNNNCIGCVKGGAGYWNKIRKIFPAHFWRMAALERKFGHAILRLGANRLPVYLDELPEDAGREVKEPEIDCSVLCAIAKQQYSS